MRNATPLGGVYEGEIAMSLKATVWMLAGLAVAIALFGVIDSLFGKQGQGNWISLPKLVPFMCYSLAGIVATVALLLRLVLAYAKPNGVLSAVAQIVGVLVFLSGTATLGWAVLMEFPLSAYQPRGSGSNSRFKIYVDKKIGFMDKQGKIVIPPQFDAADDFSEDRARVYVGSLAGFIDPQGKVVIPPKYATAKEFKNQRSVVLEGSEYKVIDPNGKVIADVPFRPLGDYHQDMVRVQKSGGTDASGKRETTVYGYMDRNGKIVIAPQYLPASEFPDDGGLAVGGLNHEWHYFDKTGKVIFRIPQPQRLEGFTTFHSGLLRVKEGFTWGYKDARGEWKIKPKYDDASDFQDGIARVELGGKWIEINVDGNPVKRPAWRALAPFSDGLRLVAEGDRIGWLTADDKPAFAFRKYDEAKSFSCGMAAVRVDGFWGYLDKSGNLAIRAVFNSASDFRDDLAWVMTNEGDTGYINTKGDFVWKSAPRPKMVLKPITGPKPPAPRQ